MSNMETFFPDDVQMEEEIAPINIKADEVKENRHGGKKGHKGMKKAPPAAPERNNGPGWGCSTEKLVFMIFVCSQYCNVKDSCNDTICVDRNNYISNYIKLHRIRAVFSPNLVPFH